MNAKSQNLDSKYYRMFKLTTGEAIFFSLSFQEPISYGGGDFLKELLGGGFLTQLDKYEFPKFGYQILPLDGTHNTRGKFDELELLIKSRLGDFKV